MKTYRLVFAALVLIALMFHYHRIINTPPYLGDILAVERSESSSEIRAIITAEHAQIKLYFPKSHPVRVDVIAKDSIGRPLQSTPQAVLKSIPDSLFTYYRLPYHEN